MLAFGFVVACIREDLHEMTELPCAEATGRVGELEGPQEVGDLLEVGANLKGSQYKSMTDRNRYGHTV